MFGGGGFFVVVGFFSFIFPLSLSSPLTPVSDISRDICPAAEERGWGADARRYHQDGRRAQGEVARSL